MSAAPTATPAPWAELASFDASTTIAMIRGAIANPSKQPTLTMLIIGVAALVVIILVVMVLLLITPRRKRIVKIRRYYRKPPGAGGAATEGGEQVEGGPKSAAGGAPGEAAETHAAEATGATRAEAAVAAAPATATIAAGGPKGAKGTKGAAKPARAPRKKRRLSQRAFDATIFAAILIAAIGTYAATSTNLYCARTCHSKTPTVAAALTQGHAACVSCHEGSIFNLIGNTASRARMFFAYAEGKSPAAPQRAVDSAACYRCHRTVRREPVTSEVTGVRMSHAEVLDGGLPCSECHARTGHDGVVFTASMSACIPCHDGKAASAECETCHTTDPSMVAVIATSTPDGGTTRGSGKYLYPAVKAAKRECGGCHDEATTCDPCHGLRMPHSAAFKEGAHARNAAFDLKTTCWRCHDPASCGAPGCHRGAFDPDGLEGAHGRTWKQQHTAVAWDAGCVCHAGRGSGRKYPICFRCHASDHTLLPKSQ